MLLNDRGWSFDINATYGPEMRHNKILMSYVETFLSRPFLSILFYGSPKRSKETVVLKLQSFCSSRLCTIIVFSV